MFALIGVVNTTVHFVVFTVLMRWFAVPMLLASIVGFAAGVANSYWMNRTWTFVGASRANARQFAKFLLVNLVALGVNLLVLHLLAQVWGWLPELAQLGAIAFTLVVNFAGNKLWTFRVQHQ